MLASGMIEAEPLANAPHSVKLSASSLVPGAELAREIGAEGHALFTLVRRGHGKELEPVLRSDFPTVPPAAATRLAECVARSIQPLWWARDAESGLEGLRWACRLDATLPGPAGMAFPVVAGRSDLGLVAFVGSHLSISDRNLPDLHRRCCGLFAGRRDSASREKVFLAKREVECIRLAADGLTSDEIAKALGLSLHTANQYLTDAARKLNANGRMHAVAKALRLGLID